MSDNNERMQNLMSTVRENSPTGKEILNEAFGRGCAYVFEVVENSYGFYDDATNKVVLNPNFSDDELLSTIVHESRHAIQPREYTNPRNDIQTNIAMVRAKEADAMAYECMAAYEMKSFVPQVFAKFSDKYKDIADAFLKNKEKSKGEVLSASFQAWYTDLNYVDKYDSPVADYLFKMSPRCGAGGLKNHKDPEKIADDVCLCGGQRYLPQGFITSEAAMTLKESGSVKMLKSVQNIMKNVHEVEDNTLNLFYIKADNGQIKAPAVEFIQKSKPAKEIPTPVKGVSPELWGRVVTLGKNR